jgi:hypothetical protein
MKLIISLFILSFSVFAHKVLILNAHTDHNLEVLIKEKFMADYGLPVQLIETQSVDHCNQNVSQKKYLILCIDKKKELAVLNSSSQIIKTLSIFKRL